MLYQVLQEHLETFMARTEDAGGGHGLPEFVKRELRGFLRCGILSYGFARCWCPTCRDDLLVALSCRGRGFCPSCCGRRMADTAAHLVDRVIPEVPVRQWVISLPHPLRYRLAYDSELRTAVLGVFIRAVTGHYRRAAKRRGLGDPRCGAVTAIQRAGDGLRLNLHYHALFADGVFTRESDEAEPCFHAIEVEDDDVARVVETFRVRVLRLLTSRGLLGEQVTAASDPLASADPLLAACYQASVQGLVATGERAGSWVRRQGTGGPREPSKANVKSELCARVDGFDLHARQRVKRHRRGDLERLCRYVLRPPLATDRLRWLDEGRTQVALDLKRTWSDGTRSLVFTPLELIEKLVPLIPAPRSNQVRYHGVLAPGSTWRSAVVAPLATKPTDESGEPNDDLPPSIRPRRLGWAALLMRVLGVDVLTCTKCGGKRKIIAFIQEPAAARQILQHLGLPHQPPPIAPARAPPQGVFEL